MLAQQTLSTASADAQSQPLNLMNVTDPRIVIKKGARTLELFDGERLVKTYPMVLGFAPVGDKEVVGDGKTPEGEFYIFVKNDKSKFYLSLGLSYPDATDAKHGLEKRLITRSQHDQIVDAIARKRMPPQNTKLGGEIYIHGGGTGRDWTLGCVALDNDHIKELFDVAQIGTKVRILP
jgi:murein L,D-transpeptidase YafK